jgi:hypothetical protein
MFAQETSAQDIAVRNAYMQLVEKHHKHHPKEHDKRDGKDVEKVEQELEKAADELKEDVTAALAAITEETDSVRASFERHFNALNKYYDDIYAAVKAGDMDLARAHLAALKGYSVKDDKHAAIHDENGHLKESKLDDASLRALHDHLNQAHQALAAGDLAKAKDHVGSAKTYAKTMTAYGEAHDRIQPIIDKVLKESLDALLVEALHNSDFEARARVASSTKDAELLSSMAQTHMSEQAPGSADILNHIARNPATPKHVVEQLARHSDTKVAATASSMLSAGVHGGSGPTDISPVIKEEVLMEMASIPLAGAGEVAKAFLDGRAAKKGSASTDGQSFKLHGNTIATHNGDKVKFDWAGWYTPTTASHMNTILHHMTEKAGLPKYSGHSVGASTARKNGDETFDVDKATVKRV